MSASPLIVPAAAGGWDLFVVTPAHDLLHAYCPTPVSLLTPAWEDLSPSVVYEIDAAYDKTTGDLAVIAHGGPAGVGGVDRLYVKVRTANGWGVWGRIDNVDIA